MNIHLHKHACTYVCKENSQHKGRGKQQIHGSRCSSEHSVNQQAQQNQKCISHDIFCMCTQVNACTGRTYTAMNK